MSHAHDLSLRAGWYPDPDGDYCYRKWDGIDWTDETAPVPPARRSSFMQQQRAMARRAQGTGTTSAAAAARRRQMQGLPSGIEDPGQTTGVVSLVMALIGLSIIGLILARVSRKKSQAVGLGRNGWSLAGLIMSWIQLGIIVLYIVVAVGVLTIGGTLETDSASSASAADHGKSVVNAVETCASLVSDGSYGKCSSGGAALAEHLEPGADTVSRCSGMPEPGSACVEPIGTAGYVVRATAERNGEVATFVERHGPDGSLTKACKPDPC